MLDLVKTLNGFRNPNIYKDTEFQKVYEKLLLSNDINDFSSEDIEKIFFWAIVFLNQKFLEAQKLGYRMILRYCNISNDYLPLYDVSLNLGFIPVAKFIEKNFFPKETANEKFLNVFLSSFKENFKDMAADKEIYLSAGQKRLVQFAKKCINGSLVVAPTSYGKSEMIINRVSENQNKKICIIVPSKALLAQTKRRLLENDSIVAAYKRVITHPEMYRSEDTSFIAVLTQERLLRLMQTEKDFSLDHLMIDEAHNLLSKDKRAELLLQVLLILRKRNEDINLSFFTPFIAKPSSIETKYANYDIIQKTSTEFIKIERYFIYDLKNNGQLSFYDQFTDSHIDINFLGLSKIDFIWNYRSTKNILYANRPRHAERLAEEISRKCPAINLELDDDVFNEACEAIGGYLHEDYSLLKHIRKGVVYHHGKMPEIVRLYIEQLFTKHPDFKFIATTSTLLEGVNIPADKIFVVSPNKGLGHLKKSEFKNLTGRICRFSEIFSDTKRDLKALEPEVYLLKIGKPYSEDDFNPRTFLSKNAKINPNDKDVVQNVLLQDNVKEDDKKRERAALEFLENIEANTLENFDNNSIDYAFSKIGKSCFANNIYEIDIIYFEEALNKRYESFQNSAPIQTVKDVIQAINFIFIEIMNLEANKELIHRDNRDEALARLKYPEAQESYAKFLQWRIEGSSYNKMIGKFIAYWKKLTEEKPRALVYVGSAWGEEKRDENDWVERYVYIGDKNDVERINLAILRIKEEQDFVDYKILKFIEVLNDLGIIDKTLYESIKYGSTDKKVICMLKNGISMELAKILLDEKYSQFLNFNIEKDIVTISKSIKLKMIKEKENKIHIFEVEFHI